MSSNFSFRTYIRYTLGKFIGATDYAYCQSRNLNFGYFAVADFFTLLNLHSMVLKFMLYQTKQLKRYNQQFKVSLNYQELNYGNPNATTSR